MMPWHFHFGGIIDQAAKNIIMQTFVFEFYCSGIKLKNTIAVLYDNLMFSFIKIVKLFSRVAVTFFILTGNI